MHIIQIPSKADIQTWVREVIASEVHEFAQRVMLELDNRALAIGGTVLNTTDSVDKLKLSCRASNALYVAKIKTIGDLIQLSPSEVMKIRNCGHLTFKEIQWSLARSGHRLKDKEFCVVDKKPLGAATPRGRDQPAAPNQTFQ